MTLRDIPLYTKKFKETSYAHNKYGHIKKDCKGNIDTKLFIGYCFNCWLYGLKSHEGKVELN